MAPRSSGVQFGDEVRRLRKEKGFTLRGFARMVDMSPTYLSKVERNALPPPGEQKVLAIARILGRDGDEFLALADRVASDLPEIIKDRPREMATFLRTAKGLALEDLRKLTRQAQKKKQGS